MAVTRLERKGQKNKSRAKARVKTIKRLGLFPVIKNVDVEAIKAEFAKPKKAEKKEEAPVEEAKAEAVVEAPTEEKKAAKKPAAKKVAAKKPAAKKVAAKKPAAKKVAAKKGRGRPAKAKK